MFFLITETSGKKNKSFFNFSLEQFCEKKDETFLRNNYIFLEYNEDVMLFCNLSLAKRKKLKVFSYFQVIDMKRLYFFVNVLYPFIGCQQN
jgi:hypothetical protein